MLLKIAVESTKPDPERIKPLLNLPLPDNFKALYRVLDMLAYYAKWISSFADKVRLLAECKVFPFTDNALKFFELLKTKLVKAPLRLVDESLPLIVECDTSDLALSATLNQGSRRAAFMSRTLKVVRGPIPPLRKKPRQ